MTAWVVLACEIGRNVPVVTTGSIGLNSRCPRGGSLGVSRPEPSLGGLWPVGLQGAPCCLPWSAGAPPSLDMLGLVRG